MVRSDFIVGIMWMHTFKEEMTTFIKVSGVACKTLIGGTTSQKQQSVFLMFGYVTHLLGFVPIAVT